MALRSLFQLAGKRQIYRVLVSHTARSLAYSFVGVYIPIYFLTRGYTLPELIGYYALLHGTGLLLALTLIPYLIQRLGIISAFKLNYPFEMLHLLLLFSLPFTGTSIYWIAPVAAATTFFYWIPFNILLIKNADFDKMGTDLASFFALPKFFGIIGPLAGAGLIYLVGFWPTFLIAMIGILLSYIPLAGIRTDEIKVEFHWHKALRGLWRRKRLFFFEALDNIAEESQWFWGIYAFLIIGSLAVPGIAGSLASLGAVLFTYFVGKRVDRANRPVLLAATLALAAINALCVFIATPLQVYLISLVTAFVTMAFLVAYSSAIYREVKGDAEEEFVVRRGIPAVLGRMLVFLGILSVADKPQLYFIFPALVMLCLALGVYRGYLAPTVR